MTVDKAAAPVLHGENSENDAHTVVFLSRYLGVGFLLAWDWCVHIRDNIVLTVSVDAPSSIPSAMLSMGSSLICVVLLVLFALASVSSHASHATHASQTKSFLTNRWFGVLAAVCAVLGSIIRIAIANDLVSGMLFDTLYAVLVGFATAALMLCWADIYARLTVRSVCLYGSLSFVISALTVFLIGWMNQPMRLVLTTVLPLISGAMLWLSESVVYAAPTESRHEESSQTSQSSHETDDPVNTEKHLRYLFPWKPVVIMAIAGFIGDFVALALFTQGAVPHIAAQAIVGVFIFIFVAIPGSRMSINAFIPISLGILSIAMVVLALVGQKGAFAVALLATISSVLASAFTLTLVADVSRRRQIPSAWLFGLTLAAWEFTSHAGGFINLAMPGVIPAMGDRFQLAVVSVIGLLGVIALGILWLSERSKSADWTMGAVDADTGQKVRTAAEEFSERCAILGRTNGLSEREIEVMEMLAEKYPYQQIAQDLVLSLNTVKSHAHHIYTKLDIHTRDELLALINDKGTGHLSYDK